MSWGAAVVRVPYLVKMSHSLTGVGLLLKLAVVEGEHLVPVGVGEAGEVEGHVVVGAGVADPGRLVVLLGDGGEPTWFPAQRGLDLSA